MKIKTILLLCISLFNIYLVEGQSLDSKSILFKSLWNRNNMSNFMVDVYYSGRRVGEEKEYFGRRVIIVNEKDGFIEKRQNHGQKIPDYTYEFGDSIFYWYFDPLDSTFLLESDLKQDFSKSYGLKSYWIKLSLNRLVDSSANNLFGPLVNDTIIRGKSCWELSVKNHLFPTGYVDWSVFVSKLDTLLLGSYQHEVSLDGDTTVTFSFIDSINTDNGIQRQKILAYLNEIEKLKINRVKRTYNNFVLDPMLFNGSIKEFKAYSFLKGDSVNINLEKGKYLLDFWFVGCFPCSQSFPFLNDLEEKYSNHDVKFFKLNPVNYKDPDKVKRYAKLHVIENNNYLVAKKICHTFGIEKYPSFVFVEDGQIIRTFRGFDLNVYNELKLFLEKWTSDSR